MSPRMLACVCAGPSRSRSLPGPSEPEKLATLNSSIKGNACIPVPLVWPGQAGFTEPRGEKDAVKEAVSAFPDGPANWPAERETARGCLFPPVHHTPDPLDSTIQTEEGIRMYIFCLPWQENCRAEEKNKLSLALSAASWGSLLPSSEGGPAALFSFPAAPLRL